MKLKKLELKNITKIKNEFGLDWEKEYLKSLVEKTNQMISEIEIKKEKWLTHTEIDYYKQQFTNIGQELYMLRFLINISERQHKVFLATVMELRDKLNKMLNGDEWIV